jgi:hypothetical protein
MAARKTVDRRPGPLPDIQMDGDSVIFTLDLVDPLDSRLVVRCDAHGEVYARIRPAAPKPFYPFTAGE